jgi:hypothetical protein
MHIAATNYIATAVGRKVNIMVMDVAHAVLINYDSSSQFTFEVRQDVDIKMGFRQNM